MAPTQPSFVSQPSIVRIPVLLHELLAGELLIPRFQRPSIWSSEQQIRLLDSINRNYPIGSVLVWRTRTHELAHFTNVGGLVIRREESRGPEYKQYVLDGHQRLSTLLRMLGPGLISADALQETADEREEDDTGSEDVGDVFYNLESEEFVREAAHNKRDERWLPVAILLDPYRLDAFKVKLAKSRGKDGRRLGQLADELAARFKDYTLPVTPLASEDLEFVTESFRRVNSAGSVMSEVHMVHALSWTKDMDLVARLDEIQHRFTERGWDELSKDTLLTVCKVMTGLDPAQAHPDALKEKIRTDQDLLPQAEKCLESATDFLSRLNVRGFKILPYEHSMVVLAFVASQHGGRLPKGLYQQLERWFWYITYTAYLANHVSLRKMIASLRKSGEEVLFPTDADPRVVAIRQIHFHSARTRAFALQLARVGPLGPKGHSIASDTLALHGGDALVRLLPRKLVGKREGAPENRVLLPPKHAAAIRALCLQSDDSPTVLRARVLRSHLITEEAEKALDKQRYVEFLDLRRAEIDRIEGEFVRALGLHFNEMR